MKKILSLIMIVTVVFLVSGCQTTGLSAREQGQYNYSSMIYSIYDTQSAHSKEKEVLEPPIKLAVAQIGEAGAPQRMIDALEKQPNIKEVVSIPAAGIKLNFPMENQADDSNLQLKKMRSLAADLGMDYLFIFGGSADYETTSNILSIFDFTIIGAFIFPSQQHMAEGKAAGALLNVHTGQVVFIVNSEAESKKATPSYMEYSYGMYNTNNSGVLKDLRDKLVTQITTNFVNQLAKS